MSVPELDVARLNQRLMWGSLLIAIMAGADAIDSSPTRPMIRGTLILYGISMGGCGFTLFRARGAMGNVERSGVPHWAKPVGALCIAAGCALVALGAFAILRHLTAI